MYFYLDELSQASSSPPQLFSFIIVYLVTMTYKQLSDGTKAGTTLSGFFFFCRTSFNRGTGTCVSLCFWTILQGQTEPCGALQVFYSLFTRHQVLTVMHVLDVFQTLFSGSLTDCVDLEDKLTVMKQSWGLSLICPNQM